MKIIIILLIFFNLNIYAYNSNDNKLDSVRIYYSSWAHGCLFLNYKLKNYTIKDEKILTEIRSEFNKPFIKYNLAKDDFLSGVGLILFWSNEKQDSLYFQQSMLFGLNNNLYKPKIRILELVMAYWDKLCSDTIDKNCDKNEILNYIDGIKSAYDCAETNHTMKFGSNDQINRITVYYKNWLNNDDIFNDLYDNKGEVIEENVLDINNKKLNITNPAEIKIIANEIKKINKKISVFHLNLSRMKLCCIIEWNNSKYDTLVYSKDMTMRFNSEEYKPNLNILKLLSKHLNKRNKRIILEYINEVKKIYECKGKYEH